MRDEGHARGHRKGQDQRPQDHLLDGWRRQARGICGSGLVDAIAELVAEQIIDQSGKFIKYEHPRVRVVDEVTEFVLAQPGETATGEAVVITEDDIGNLIKSKGAVLAAMKVLLENLDISFNDLETIYVAGGFGAHLDIDKAIFIGLASGYPQRAHPFYRQQLPCRSADCSSFHGRLSQG